MCVYMYFTDVEKYYSSLKADIQEEAVNKIVFNYASPSYGACLTSEDTLFSLAQDNKMMQKLNIPKEKPKKVCDLTAIFLSRIWAQSYSLS